MVVTGRNDGHGGDFQARFFRTLRFNLDRLREAGVSHEVVVVEWCPPPDRPLLVDLLDKALPGVIGRSVRAYVVDERYQQACSLNPALSYLEFMAKNVGLRRAGGRFVLATNADIYLSRGVIERLAGDALDRGTLYRALRIDITLGTDESHVSWAMLEDQRNHHPYRRMKPPLYAGASGDFALIDRDSLHRLRGYNEVYRLARVGPDVNFLVKAYASGYPIADIGAPIYHTNHVGSFQVSKGVIEGEAAEREWGTQQWASQAVIYENADTWGLAAAPEREVRNGVTRLEFDWDAVPPLADLRRIVLPPALTGQTQASADDTAEV